MRLGSWHDWRTLLRAANVFTALANPIAGALLVTGRWPPLGPLAWVAAAAVLLYEAGMVLNDVFDAELDARERPERPLPAGRIDPRAARCVGGALLGGGVAAAAAASWSLGHGQPLLVASCLAVAIWLYDAGLKSTWAGPLAMGWCRALNFLLGASLVAPLRLDGSPGWVAGCVGLYTAGLTIVARSEVVAGRRGPLVAGAALAATAVGGLAGWGWTSARNPSLPLWSLGVAAIAWSAVGVRPQRWLSGADPLAVRRHVGGMIMGFLAIDAYVAGLSAGWGAAAAVAALALPTRRMARAIPMS
jgi:4-hydroxybenzoate polyprenyltransferase